MHHNPLDISICFKEIHFPAGLCLDFMLQEAKCLGLIQIHLLKLLCIFLLQNKDLKSRILHLEGSYRSSKEGLLVQMEARIMELEERLENEER